MTALEVVLALVMLVGLVGVVVPVLPGVLLITGSLLVWAFTEGSGTGWAWTAAALVLVATGQVVKYLVPGRRLKTVGVPGRTIVVGGLAGIVGFFVIPVVGLFVGFVGGVYAAEVLRVGSNQAWPSTWSATKAVGLSILIELASALLAVSVWAAALIAT